MLKLSSSIPGRKNPYNTDYQDITRHDVLIASLTKHCQECGRQGRLRPPFDGRAQTHSRDPAGTAPSRSHLLPSSVISAEAIPAGPGSAMNPPPSPYPWMRMEICSAQPPWGLFSWMMNAETALFLPCHKPFSNKR